MTDKWLACQSMDNQIVTFGVHNRFRQNKKKTFKGHMVSFILVRMHSWSWASKSRNRTSLAKFSQIPEALQDSHRLFGSRNSPTTGILHTIRHVYRSVWPAEKLSLALVQRSNVLRMIVKLGFSSFCIFHTEWNSDKQCELDRNLQTFPLCIKSSRKKEICLSDKTISWLATQFQPEVKVTNWLLWPYDIKVFVTYLCVLWRHFVFTGRWLRLPS